MTEWETPLEWAYSYFEGVEITEEQIMQEEAPSLPAWADFSGEDRVAVKGWEKEGRDGQ